MRFFGLVVGLCAALPVSAHEYFLGDLQIIHPAIPATPAQANSVAVYMALANDGAQDERLLGIETPFGPVRFVHPVTDATGVVTMQERAWIDIPAGDIVLLARGDLRGSLANVNRALSEGGTLGATMIFQERGRFDMAFMLDPMETETQFDPVADPQTDALQQDRATTITDIATALRAGLGTPEAIVAPVSFVGNVALAGWTFGNSAARVFLRKGDAGWQVEVVSNDSLLLPATLTSLGVAHAESIALLREVTAQETALGPSFTLGFDAFEGTAYREPDAQ